MTVNYLWSGTDIGTNEVIDYTTTQSFNVAAPTGDLWSFARLILSVSVRAQTTTTSGIPEIWWVGSEVQLDAVFSDDGNDFLPDTTGSDPRIVMASHLQPAITYPPTAGHISVAYNGPAAGYDIRSKKTSDVVPSVRRNVWVHLNMLDQHGVFANGGSLTNRSFNIDLFARVLWYLKT